MNYTTNYQLPQWVETDRILMDDFNDMTGKLETALSGKVSQSDHAALSAQVAGLSADVEALDDTVDTRGNCKIFEGFYTGTGTSGEDNPSQLFFNERLVFAYITDDQNDQIMRVVRGCSHALNSGLYQGATVEWSSMGASIYADTPAAQMNAPGQVYRIYAWLDCEN